MKLRKPKIGSKQVINQQNRIHPSIFAHELEQNEHKLECQSNIFLNLSPQFDDDKLRNQLSSRTDLSDLVSICSDVKINVQPELKCSEQSRRCLWQRRCVESSNMIKDDILILPLHQHEINKPIQQRSLSSIKCLPIQLLILIACLNFSRGIFCLNKSVHLSAPIIIFNLNTTTNNDHYDTNNSNQVKTAAFHSLYIDRGDDFNDSLTSKGDAPPPLIQARVVSFNSKIEHYINESHEEESTELLPSKTKHRRVRQINKPKTTRTTTSTTTELSPYSSIDYDSYLQNEDDEATESRYIALNTNQSRENSSMPKVPQDTNDTASEVSKNINDANGIASSFVNSLFSHIDKQWKFAEVIVVIVVSAILNLVTIIGNIMVLISFKMDRS